MDYPKTFSSCPCCGSTNRFAEQETKEEIEKGHLKSSARVPVLVTRSQLFDFSDMQTILARRSFPVLVGFFDVCSDCGSIYCCEMQKATGVIDPQIRTKPPDNGGGL